MTDEKRHHPSLTPSHQTAISQIVLDDNVIDGSHDKLDLGRVRGTGEMGIDLLCLGLVQGQKLLQKELAGSVIVRTPGIFRKVLFNGAGQQLVLEPINLVEKEDDGGLDKPAAVADRVKEGKGFLHSIL
jgi:hypothetical protein